MTVAKTKKINEEFEKAIGGPLKTNESYSSSSEGKVINIDRLIKSAKEAAKVIKKEDEYSNYSTMPGKCSI